MDLDKKMICFKCGKGFEYIYKHIKINGDSYCPECSTGIDLLCYIIPCRRCGSTGCKHCVWTGQEAVSKDEKLVEGLCMEGLKCTPEQDEIIREI